jgi:hypothetical protein
MSRLAWRERSAAKAAVATTPAGGFSRVDQGGRGKHAGLATVIFRSRAVSHRTP